MLTKPFTFSNQEDPITKPRYSPLHYDSRTKPHTFSIKEDPFTSSINTQLGHKPEEEIHEEERSEEVDETKLDNECQEFLDDQTLRKEIIKTFCDARVEYKVNKSWGMLLHHPTLNITYCKHPKVASSTMYSEMTHLMGLGDEKDFQSLEKKKQFNQIRASKVIPYLSSKTKKMSQLEKIQLVNNTMSFSIVRHPLSRVVSIYKNKVYGKTTGFQQKPKAHFREPRMKMLQKYGKLDWVSVAKLVTDDIKENCTPQGCIEEIRRVDDKGKFKGINQHLIPFAQNCDYCNMPYKYILFLETYDRDLHCMGKIENIGKILIY